AENGCHLLGLASPTIGLSLYNIDVTLSGCNYSGFNRRYGGTLARLTKEKKASTLNLFSSQVVPGKGPSSFDIKANLRR
ncbi:MAG: hypothetical protein WCC58_08735, partial [Burkholderiales bacterium]